MAIGINRPTASSKAGKVLWLAKGLTGGYFPNVKNSPSLGDTIILMPPLSITEAEITRMVDAVSHGIREVCG